jgi:hypothetical protein
MARATMVQVVANCSGAAISELVDQSLRRWYIEGNWWAVYGQRRLSPQGSAGYCARKAERSERLGTWQALGPPHKIGFVPSKFRQLEAARKSTLPCVFTMGDFKSHRFLNLFFEHSKSLTRQPPKQPQTRLLVSWSRRTNDTKLPTHHQIP